MDKPKGYIKGNTYEDDPENFHAKKTEHQDFVEGLCFNEGFSRATVLELLYMGYIYDPETKGWEKPRPGPTKMVVCENCEEEIYCLLVSEIWYHRQSNNRYCFSSKAPARSMAVPKFEGGLIHCKNCLGRIVPVDKDHRNWAHVASSSRLCRPESVQSSVAQPNHWYRSRP